ncbi:hypothetical protein Plhal304r1_c044g0125151 [Plasmopara halstedii]
MGEERKKNEWNEFGGRRQKLSSKSTFCKCEQIRFCTHKCRQHHNDRFANVRSLHGTEPILRQLHPQTLTRSQSGFRLIGLCT